MHITCGGDYAICLGDITCGGDTTYSFPHPAGVADPKKGEVALRGPWE